jgi:hypothetical protein
LGALSIGASEHRHRYSRLLQGCATVKSPLNDRALNTIERHPPAWTPAAQLEDF